MPATADTVRQKLHSFRMDGAEVFRHATRRMGEAMEAVLERCGLDGPAITWLIPHQANLRILQTVAKRIGIPMERVVVNVDRYGNTSAASIPIALHEARSRFRPGDIVGFVAFGGGFSWGATLVRW